MNDSPLHNLFDWFGKWLIEGHAILLSSYRSPTEPVWEYGGWNMIFWSFATYGQYMLLLMDVFLDWIVWNIVVCELHFEFSHPLLEYCILGLVDARVCRTLFCEFFPLYWVADFWHIAYILIVVCMIFLVLCQSLVEAAILF